MAAVIGIRGAAGLIKDQGGRGKDDKVAFAEQSQTDGDTVRQEVKTEKPANQDVLAKAELLSAQYDYDKAIRLLKG